MIGVVAFSLLTPACLFSMNPAGGDGGGGTNNNVTDLCATTVCELPGEVCSPTTGECRVVTCGFTNEANGYQSTCLSGWVCQLDLEGLGYCAPPCSSNNDCFPGVRCEQKYSDVVGGGLCIPSGVLSCDDPLYNGLCRLGSETCDPISGACIPDGVVEETCFTPPDPFDAACVFRECEFEGPDSDDSVCVRDPGTGGAPALVGTCHYNPTARPGAPFNGYCDDPCGDDVDCVEPGAFCNDGRCYPKSTESECPPLTFFDDDQCKTYLCDNPDSQDGDRSCEEQTGEPGVKCSAGVFGPDNEPRGACLFDCRADEMLCEGVSPDDALVCDGETGRCVEGEGESTLNTACADDSECNRDEQCKGPPDNPQIPSRCILPCDNDSVCSDGSVCVLSRLMGIELGFCAVGCMDSADCAAGLQCKRVGMFTESVCAP